MGVGVKGAAADALSDSGEEEVDGVEVVDLEEGPGEHFLCGEEVMDVCAVVGFAGVAGAVVREGPGVSGVVVGGPEVVGEGTGRCRCFCAGRVRRRCREDEIEGDAGVGTGAQEGHREEVCA